MIKRRRRRTASNRYKFTRNDEMRKEIIKHNILAKTNRENKAIVSIISMVMYCIQMLSKSFIEKNNDKKNQIFKFVRNYSKSLPDDIQVIITRVTSLIQLIDQRGFSAELTAEQFMQFQHQIRQWLILSDEYFPSDEDACNDMLDQLNTKVLDLFETIQAEYLGLLKHASIVTKPKITIKKTLPSAKKQYKTRRPFTSSSKKIFKVTLHENLQENDKYIRPLTSTAQKNTNYYDGAAKLMIIVFHKLLSLLDYHFNNIEFDKVCKKYDKLIHYFSSLDDPLNLDKNKMNKIWAYWNDIILNLIKFIQYIHLYANFDSKIVDKKLQINKYIANDNNNIIPIKLVAIDFQHAINHIKENFTIKVQRYTIREEIKFLLADLMAKTFKYMKIIHAKLVLNEALYNRNSIELEAGISTANILGLNTDTSHDYLFEIKMEEKKIFK